jgi:hypothetical protein
MTTPADARQTRISIVQVSRYDQFLEWQLLSMLQKWTVMKFKWPGYYSGLQTVGEEMLKGMWNVQAVTVQHPTAAYNITHPGWNFGCEKKQSTRWENL